MANFSVNTAFTDSVTGMTLSKADTFILTDSDSVHVMGDVPTGEYTYTLGNIGSAGYIFLKNHALTESAEDYVDVGIATTVYFIRLFPGQAGILPIDPTTSAIYLKANQGRIPVEIYSREA